MSQPTPTYSLFWVIFALAMGGFCIGTTEFLAMGLIQEIAHDLAISIPQAGYLISAYALGVMIGAPIIAILATKLPRKTVLMSLMLFYAIANISTAFFQTIDSIIISRFVAGLPHGAYFGIGALVVAELAGHAKRSSAIAQMMMGLTIATVLGVPLATWLGQHWGWRIGFEFSASLAFLTIFAIGLCVPKISAQPHTSMRSELAGLKNINMWLTLAVGAIGFGGMFSVYSYVSPILTQYTQTSVQMIPIALAIWGIGMVLGGLCAGHFADKNLNKTIFIVLISAACTFILCNFMLANLYTALMSLFLIGFTVMGLGGTLQTRLMDIAGDAQTLAASLNHSAFNLANALGAFLGGWVLHNKMGWLAPIWVGFLFSVGGLILFIIALTVEKKSHQRSFSIS